MKYYKIIQDNTFIGIINSNSFIAYQNVNHMFIGADEELGDLVECNDKLYRALWMKPINQEITISYEIVDIIEITYEEYINFQKAIDNNITIENEDTTFIPPVTPIIHNVEMGIDFIRSSKLNEMSYACQKTIEDGFDLELRGAAHHFSLTTQDQLNLMSLGTMVQTSNEIPYHADGEEVIFYTSEEINQIIAAANAFKTYQTTYYNSLKTYINSLETIEEISAIEYGIEIPEKFKTEVLKALEHK